MNAPLRNALAAMIGGTPMLWEFVAWVQRRYGPEPSPIAMVWATRSVFLERFGMTLWVAAVLALVCVPWLIRRATRARDACRVSAIASVIASIIGELRW